MISARSVPIFLNPLRGANLFVNLLSELRFRPLAADGFVHVRLAGEGDNACLCGRAFGFDEVAHGPGRDEFGFEAGAPFEREHGELAQCPAAEGLTVGILLEHPNRVGAEALPDLGQCTDSVAENRHVADAGSGLRPVFRDNIPGSRQVVEKVVDGSGHDEVQIEVQDIAFEVIQRFFEEEHPAEPFIAKGLGQVEFGHWPCLDFAFQTLGVVGDADKAEGALRVFSDHGFEAIDILRAIAITPFKANDSLLLGACVGHREKVVRGRTWRSCRRWDRVASIELFPGGGRRVDGLLVEPIDVFSNPLVNRGLWFEVELGGGF